MSSVHCKKCQERIWDKYDGLIGGTKEIKGVSVCGFCGHKELLRA